ncbi:MAG: ADP-ribosylglycohydrolase family protein [Rhodospirillales bacterium]|nr:ADP-ribosylglycohydrolase family protein [Rhodospirillales bacterium]MCB9996746.1 ADP-ribosylglycohydrolase family protein [Rhodospirillales bacterium]
MRISKEDGFLVYMAIGDAYGMAYEFADDIAAVGPNDLTYKENPRHPAYRKGHYTDDTQMALANMHAVIENRYQLRNDNPQAKLLLCDTYVCAFKRDPRPGYSRYMQEFFEKINDGAEMLRRLYPKFSNAGGAAMRAGPIGLLPNMDEIMETAALQATVTHNNRTGKLSAALTALAVHAMHYNLCPKAELQNWLHTRFGRWEHKFPKDDPKNGLYIVDKALQAVHDAETLSDVLRGCVDFGPGQDTDTIAAIAMCIASRSQEIGDDLPDHLFDELENGPYGYDFLRRIDSMALRGFPRDRNPASRPSPAGQFVPRP